MHRYSTTSFLMDFLLSYLVIYLLIMTPRSGHVPVLTAVGESPSGQVLCVDSNHAAIRIAQVLQPRKVMFLNTNGGLVDRHGNVSGRVLLYVLHIFMQNYPATTFKNSIIIS